MSSIIPFWSIIKILLTSTEIEIQISYNCVKSVQIRSFFWSVFCRIWTEYGDLLCKSPYSVQIWENTDQKKLRIWTIFMRCMEYIIRRPFYKSPVLNFKQIKLYVGTSERVFKNLGWNKLSKNLEKWRTGN